MKTPVQVCDGTAACGLSPIGSVLLGWSSGSVRDTFTLRSGTLVDAPIIDAPSSTKSKSKVRGPEMSSTKKGNDWYFGMKAKIGVDVGSGVTHSLETSTAKMHDS
jgi:IS5 family transposase